MLNVVHLERGVRVRTDPSRDRRMGSRSPSLPRFVTNAIVQSEARVLNPEDGSPLL